MRSPISRRRVFQLSHTRRASIEAGGSFAAAPIPQRFEVPPSSIICWRGTTRARDILCADHETAIGRRLGDWYTQSSSGCRTVFFPKGSYRDHEKWRAFLKSIAETARLDRIVMGGSEMLDFVTCLWSKTKRAPESRVSDCFQKLAGGDRLAFPPCKQPATKRIAWLGVALQGSGPHAAVEMSPGIAAPGSLRKPIDSPCPPLR